MIYVFDLDGTLIDSSSRHALLMRKVLNKFNINVPNNFDNDFLSYKADRHSGKLYLEEILKLDETQAAEINKEWIQHIEDEEWLETDKLYPDSIPTLNVLSRQQIVYLSSRNREQAALEEVKRLGICSFANSIYIVNPFNGNNKIDVLRKLAKTYQDKIIMIGDTENDYFIDDRQEIQSFVLNRGFRSKSYWDNRGIQSYDSLSCLPIFG